MSGLTKIKSISNRFKNFILATAFVLTQLMVPLTISSTAIAANVGCIPDTAGANDEPGQKDLTKLCSDDTNAPTSIDVSWDWDDTGTSGGGQSLDACGLFDSDNDGNVNYSICVTTKGDPATSVDQLTIYSCSDQKVDRCTNPSKIKGTYDTTCTVSQQADDPFAAGNAYPTDTVADCTFMFSDLPELLTSIEFTDVCSYPSREPNSDPSDCVVFQTKAGFLEVQKELTPSDDPGEFNLLIDGTAYATQVGDGGTTDQQVVSVGNHTVSEAAYNASTNLADYDAYVTCRDQGGTGDVVAEGTGNSIDVNVADNDDIVCVFANTRQQATLILQKTVVNNNGGTLTQSSFPVYIDQTLSSWGEHTVSPGSYLVSEQSQDNYQASTWGGDCDATGHVTLASSETKTCTITNDDVAPSLTLNKVVTNDNGGTAAESAWTLNAVGASQSPTNLSGPGAAGDADVTSGSNFKADTYTLSETGGPSGYAASAWTCTNGVTVNGNNQITLTVGQTTVCTITNDDIAPTLTLRKVVANPYGGTGIATADLWTLKAQHESDNPLINMMGTLNNDASASTTSMTATAGVVYDLSESGPAGYSASDWSCTTGGTVMNGDQVTLGVGKDVTCTITNTQLSASISGYKYEVDAEGSGTTAIADWTVYLLVNGSPITSTPTNASGHYEFTGLAWGDYTLAECLNVSDGCATWTQIYAPPAVTVNGEDLTSDNNNFGNFQNGSISGYKFNDLNGNGTKDDNEPKLSGWTINLYDDQDQLLASKVTDSTGYEFTNLAPGTYKVCEEGQAGWTQTSTPECYTVNIDMSGEQNLNINFGNQGRGTITVKKNVDTNGDGTVDDYNVSTWTWDLSGSYINDADYQNIATGTTKSDLPVDTYGIHEDQQTNYHFVSVVCSDESGAMDVTQAETTSVDLGVGKNIVCTFTNARDAGYLKVVKDVVNDNSGDKTYADFHFAVNGGDPQSFEETSSPDGAKTVKVVTGSYTVTEPEANTMGYMTAYDNCSEVQVTTDNNIENPAVCTITNNDVAHPGIHIVKSGPTVVHEGDSITFTGTITNTGDAPLNVVGVQDNVAGTVTIEYDNGYPVGDDNQNGLLDINETWVGTVQYTVPDGQTDDIVNTMTVCANDATGTEIENPRIFTNTLQESELTGDVCDSDSHTTDVLHPAIHVVKSGKNSAPAGSTVTYTFTVTNTGDTPLTVSSVIDTIAGNGVYQSGDTNKDGLLDLDETWVYTADYKIPSNQITNVNNTVTVCANDQLEKQVCDSDSHSLTIPKVLGASTVLPNTGQGPLLNFIAGAMLILLALGARLFGRKPQGSIL